MVAGDSPVNGNPAIGQEPRSSHFKLVIGAEGSGMQNSAGMSSGSTTIKAAK